MEPEIWKDLAGYEGLYQVSNLGRVRSVSFTNNQVRNLPRLHIMRPFDNGSGYLMLSLTKEGQRKNYYVHRLVAAAFLPNYEDLPVINHRNHDTKDNRVENLEWCTQKENVHHSRALMKHPKSRAKVPPTGEKYIRHRGKTGKIYELNIRNLGISKRFSTLEEAVQYRDEVMS